MANISFLQKIVAFYFQEKFFLGIGIGRGRVGEVGMSESLQY